MFPRCNLGSGCSGSLLFFLETMAKWPFSKDCLTEYLGRPPDTSWRTSVSSCRPHGRTTKGDAQVCSMPCSTLAVLGRSLAIGSLKILATSFCWPSPQARLPCELRNAQGRHSRTTAVPPSPTTSPKKRRSGVPERDFTTISSMVAGDSPPPA